MDVDAKVTIIHIVGGIIAALLSFALTTGLIMWDQQRSLLQYYWPW